MWTDVDSDRHDEANSQFRNFVNALKYLHIFHLRHIERKTTLSHSTNSPLVTNSPFQIL